MCFYPYCACWFWPERTSPTPTSPNSPSTTIIVRQTLTMGNVDWTKIYQFIALYFGFMIIQAIMVYLFILFAGKVQTELAVRNPQKGVPSSPRTAVFLLRPHARRLDHGADDLGLRATFRKSFRGASST
ncbi:MAG: hypothetical protein MZU97_00760 [Bacillus subtilis]|nr:hypothetical protein [Bacillus subtilis]